MVDLWQIVREEVEEKLESRLREIVRARVRSIPIPINEKKLDEALKDALRKFTEQEGR